MIRLLRYLYRVADEQLLSRLSPEAQLRSRHAVLALAHRLFPRRVPKPEFHALRVTQRAPRTELLSLPDWARLEMTALARDVDPQLDPDRFLSKAPPTWVTPFDRAVAGEVYFALLDRIHTPVDVFVMVGAMDARAAECCAKAIAQHHAMQVLVVATTSGGATPTLPPHAQWLDGSIELARLRHVPEDAQAVMARLVLQLAPPIVRVMDSALGWEVMRRHGHALSQTSRLYLDLMHESEADLAKLRERREAGVLAAAEPWLSGVITADPDAGDRWHRALGIDPSLFHRECVTHEVSTLRRMPACGSIDPGSNEATEGRVR